LEKPKSIRLLLVEKISRSREEELKKSIYKGLLPGCLETAGHRLLIQNGLVFLNDVTGLLEAAIA